MSTMQPDGHEGSDAATIPAQVQSRLRSWWERPETRAVLWLFLAMTAALVVFSAFVPRKLMGPAASPTMAAVENTITVFTIAASPVAAAVWSVALYSLLRWRHRGPERPDTDGPAIRGNTPVVAAWLVISSLLCVFLLIWGLAAMQSVTAASAGRVPLEVNVTGQQWVWTFSYPGQGGVESHELYLPVDRPVTFHVTSNDVIHSFWIVQMGIKIDANPGEVTKLPVTPSTLGTFEVRCAELCGLLHADMETYVHVVTAQDFTTWIQKQKGPAT